MSGAEIPAYADAVQIWDMYPVLLLQKIIPVVRAREEMQSLLPRQILSSTLELLEREHNSFSTEWSEPAPLF